MVKNKMLRFYGSLCIVAQVFLTRGGILMWKTASGVGEWVCHWQKPRVL